jgi:hypothetical protein
MERARSPASAASCRRRSFAASFLHPGQPRAAPRCVARRTFGPNQTPIPTQSALDWTKSCGFLRDLTLALSLPSYGPMRAAAVSTTRTLAWTPQSIDPGRVVASRSHGASIVTVMALAFGLRAAGLSTDDFNEDEIGVNVLTSASLIANHSRRRECDPASAVSTHSRRRRRFDVRRRYDALARSRSHPRARRWTVRLFVEAVHRRLSQGTHALTPLSRHWDGTDEHVAL